MYDAYRDQLPDLNPVETSEWIEALDDVAATVGKVRAGYLLRKLLYRAAQLQIGVPALVSTHYINTIPPEDEPVFPGDEEMERRIRRLIRWNAAVMVTRANKHESGIGGHISTYASSASLYEVGFNHFFRGSDHPGGGDQIFFQGHATPGIYARAYLEGRLSEDQLDYFRREAQGNGLSSYPHPRLMPDFWEFPTVSMGLGPLNAVYQARFNRYLLARGIKDTSQQRVWAFCGDGEMDEPESVAGLTLAAREGLDNLIFVVNCNLQRLDGPVRGNGKVIQELESLFRGAGWHVIKVIWGREWDDLLARDVDGLLVEKMDTTVDGEFQKFSVEDGAYIREHFFGPDPRLAQLVSHLSDAQLQRLRRGGHDYRKLYAAYEVATELEGAPVVILAHTIKGWTLGRDVEARNATHQNKKLTEEQLRGFRDRLELPISDEQITHDSAPYYHPGADSDEVRYMLTRREQLGGFVPRRVVHPVRVQLPPDDLYDEFFKGTQGQKVQPSTTGAFRRVLTKLLKDKQIGPRIVPIIPDEARTFGMEALFSQIKIYSPNGQLYDPVDSATLNAYREARDGQILEEGITEAGSMASFTAAATSYSTHGEPMIPFFIFYSMFGFQRVGDFIWALGDQRGRGFLLGATAGRTTLNGEGLQHEDGHSQLVATTVPNCLVYDPAFAYEIAVIVREGMRRMYVDNEDVFYYLTLYNENWTMPAMPEGVEDQILKGMYLFRPAAREHEQRVQLLASGSAVVWALDAQEILGRDFGVGADVWSVTSWQQLRTEALDAERHNRLHPSEAPRIPAVTRMLEEARGPVVAVSDFMHAVPDQIARWVPGPFTSLGTDGWGRSDTRAALRRLFEVDSANLVVAALHALERIGEVKQQTVEEAVARFEINPDALHPRYT